MPETRAAEKPQKVRTYTFGCKVNQFDTAAMESRLCGTGLFEAGSESDTPDVVIVNTCTVTASADRQARQLLRRIHRTHPGAKIVVTGCYAEAEPELLGRMEGVNVVLPILRQRELPKLLGVEAGDEKGEVVPLFAKRCRAVLKFQDGCNAYCSYCVLPYVRGRSKSVPLDDLRRSAAEIAANGFREIVVTGTHIGAYGRDLSPRMRFSDALSAVLEAAPEAAVRVSSLEPVTLTPDVIRLVKANGRIRPHFHIPLQSGSDTVLRRMNRKYSAKNYADRVAALVATRENTALGADVIAGFPGETEGEFAQTVDFIRRSPITYLHVFPFSPRPGTRAEKMGDDVPPAVKKERVRILRGIGAHRRREFYARFLGTVQPVMVEKSRDASGFLCGYTPHYVPVRLSGPDRLMDREVDVRLHSIETEGDDEIRISGEAA